MLNLKTEYFLTIDFISILACCHLPHRKAQMSLQQEFYFPFIELFEKTLKNVEKLRIPWFICCCCTPLHGQTSPLFQLSKLIVKNWSFIISLPPIFLQFSQVLQCYKAPRLWEQTKVETFTSHVFHFIPTPHINQLVARGPAI